MAQDDTRLAVEILLKEYETLREEVISRINSRFTILGIAVAVLTWLLASPLSDHRLMVSGVGLLVLFDIWYYFAFLIRRCSVHIMRLEQEINALVGRKLLTWETESMKHGLFNKLLELPIIRRQKL